MNQGLIPRRYAKAVLEFATERKEDRRLYEVMQTLTRAFETMPALGQAMNNPFVSSDDKRALLFTAAGVEKSDSLFGDVVTLLSRNNRLDIMRQMALAYQKLYRKANNIYRVEVTSASALSADEESRLKALIEKHLDGAKMEYEARIDPSLIGGFVITIDSERLDASVKNELEQLRLTLIGK